MCSASPAHGVSSNDIGHWNTAYDWGNHANAGYQTRVSGTCASGSAIKAVNSNGSVSCEPIPSYTAGAGLRLGGTSFSVAYGGISGDMIAPGAVSVPQLSTFTSGIVSSPTNVTLRSQYISVPHSGAIMSARVIIATGGHCAADGCGSGVVTVVASGTTNSTFTFNVDGDGTYPFTYLTPSFAVGPGTTIQVLAHANSATAPVWIRDLTVEWGD